MRFPSEVCGIRLLRGCLSLLLLLSASALHAQQQPVDPRGVVPQGMLEPLVLSGAMLVHAGDDPAYASPTLDDSGWPVLDKTHMLSSVGIEQPHNVWYRTHVHLPPGQKHLALLMRYFTGPFEVYVNGVAIGLTRRSGVGENGADLSLSYDQVAAIPDDLVRTGDLVIAIRSPLHLDKVFRVRNAGFTSQTALGLGDLTLLQSLATFHLIYVQAAPSVNALFTAIILVIAVALAFALRAQREYLALSLFLASQLLALLLDLGLILWSQSPTRLSIFAGNLLILAEVLFALEFVRLILGVGRTRLLRAYTAVMAVAFPLLALYQVAAFDSPHMHPWTSSLVNLLYGLLLAPVILLLPLYALWRWWKTRSTDVLLLSIPLLIRGCFELILLAVSALFRSVSFQLPLDVFAVDWDDVTTFLFLLSLLVFLILRTVRVARAQSRSAAEMAAAQTTQQLLLSRSSQATPGFVVESIYLPANEVGGDFFLVSPSADDGSLIVLVGDVSGKGLTAAMRVAMIMGILLRETSREPASILSALNEVLLIQGEMGFTTACCLRLEPDGRYTLANAGHIAPYLDGIECETSPSLPLGLAPGQTYDATAGRLPAGKRLVLMSDGVPEARTQKGELYGFDRLPALTLGPGSEIAATAQAFGQDDDITVLTLALA